MDVLRLTTYLSRLFLAVAAAGFLCAFCFPWHQLDIRQQLDLRLAGHLDWPSVSLAYQ